VSSNSATAQKEEAMEQKERTFSWPGPPDVPGVTYNKLETAELLIRDVKNTMKIKMKVDEK
tara:strand:+ start:243 stop:425 length:183 start_codon:yes stop_codon:yes gene_type:complete